MSCPHKACANSDTLSAWQLCDSSSSLASLTAHLTDSTWLRRRGIREMFSEHTRLPPENPARGRHWTSLPAHTVELHQECAALGKRTSPASHRADVRDGALAAPAQTQASSSTTPWGHAGLADPYTPLPGTVRLTVPPRAALLPWCRWYRLFRARLLQPCQPRWCAKSRHMHRTLRHLLSAFSHW